MSRRLYISESPSFRDNNGDIVKVLLEDDITYKLALDGTYRPQA